MDFTMIKQMSRRAHIEATLNDDEDLHALRDIFEKSHVSIDSPRKALSVMECAEFLGKCKETLDKEKYSLLLAYLRSTGNPIHSNEERLPPGECRTAEFLSAQVQSCRQVHIDNRPFSCQKSHEGNSNVQFIHPTTRQKATGYIESIWTALIGMSHRTFFLMRQHVDLPPEEERKAPFSEWDPRYGTRIVDAAQSNERIVVEHHHIITHLTTYKRPCGTYGIQRPTLVVCWGLNRGRR